MGNSRLSALIGQRLDQILATLTHPRLQKYLAHTQNRETDAVRLYLLNARISAAFLVDLHYVEVALRNKFDRELTLGFGPEWFCHDRFAALLDKRAQDILIKARRDAGRTRPKDQPLPPGKVVAELSFGFWLQLSDARYEHRLWVPYLHKAFAPRKAPKRSVFNQQMEKLRQLRNRVAHHEPIFHLDLLDAHHRIVAIANLLCPATAEMMRSTSEVPRLAMRLTKYRRHHGL